MPTLNLTKEAVDQIQPPTDAPQAYYWDESLTGFGLVVGRTGVKSFVVSGRVRGIKGSDGKDVKRRVAIGIVGQPREDGHLWSVKLARDVARDVIGQMARGEDPNATKRKPELVTAASGATGPTLREGMTAHLSRMRKKHRADRSITTFENEMTKYLAPWLDRPIADLTGAALVELHERIKAKASAREGTNPRNEKGAPLANRVITHVSACWNSLNKKLEGALGSWNPAKAVDKDVLKPKRERIAEGGLPNWAARVTTMRNPIQRDGLMLALYTGLRSEDVRSIRFEHVDWDEQTLHLPDPKGGEGAAFTIPLSATPYAILKRRKADNSRDLGGNHGGWAFPAYSNDGDVGPIGDLRQQIHTETGHARFPVEDVHTLRRTWESIAHEEGISELDQHVLSNHSFGSHNVNATYIAQHLEHLAACAEKIDAGIARRIKGTPSTTKRKKRGEHLTAVP